MFCKSCTQLDPLIRDATRLRLALAHGLKERLGRCLVATCAVAGFLCTFELRLDISILGLATVLLIRVNVAKQDASLFGSVDFSTARRPRIVCAKNSNTLEDSFVAPPLRFWAACERADPESWHVVVYSGHQVFSNGLVDANPDGLEAPLLQRG